MKLLPNIMKRVRNRYTIILILCFGPFCSKAQIVLRFPTASWPLLFTDSTCPQHWQMTDTATGQYTIQMSAQTSARIAFSDLSAYHFKGKEDKLPGFISELSGLDFFDWIDMQQKMIVSPQKCYKTLFYKGREPSGRITYTSLKEKGSQRETMFTGYGTHLTMVYAIRDQEKLAVVQVLYSMQTSPQDLARLEQMITSLKPAEDDCP